MKPQTVFDIASCQYCCGCGVCESLAPRKVKMFQVPEHGLRPFPQEGVGEKQAPPLQDAFRACPGRMLSAPETPPGCIPDLIPLWGGVLELWEAWSADPDIRFRASSGGVATAIARFALRKNVAEGVLHTVPHERMPLYTESAISITEEELMHGIGSRYTPAAPCTKLHDLIEAHEQSILIGKPCDISGAKQACAIHSSWKARTPLMMSIFCAGTPSLHGTHSLLKELGIKDPAQVQSIRYRGYGWPGDMSVTYRQTDDTSATVSCNYKTGWGDLLQPHRPWRCYICPDRTGVHADISLGDAWHKIEGALEDPGRSLVLIRSERGRSLFRQAVESGSIIAEPAAPDALEKAQPGLLRAQSKSYPRLFIPSLFGSPSLETPGWQLKQRWKKHNALKERLRDLVGTARKVFSRKLLRPLDLAPLPSLQRSDRKH